jgi:alanine racemase
VIEYHPDDQATRRAWVDVDLDALVANAGSYQRRVGVPILPMVKANGYGLGAVAVARALLGPDTWGFGVATIDEGVELRQSGIDSPVLVFAPLHPSQLRWYLEHNLRPAIGDLAALEAWLAAGDSPFHVEFDTGMHRTGFALEPDLLAVVAPMLRSAAGFEGVFGHFHSAGHDDPATESQWRALNDVIATIGVRPRFVHSSNSPGGGYGPRFAGDLARPGIHLYGGRVPGLESRAVAAVRARVTATRRVAAGEGVGYDHTWRAPHPTTIATIAIGYADGIPPRLANVGEIELAGERVPIAGTVSMDQLMVDVGDLAVSPGDVATYFGGLISLDEQAARAGANPYQILTALGTRLPRRYHRSK